MRFNLFGGSILLPLMLCCSVGAVANPVLEDGTALVSRVLHLLDERLALMPDVAAAKWISQQPVTDPAREAAIIRAVGESAAGVGLARGPIETLFTLQIIRAREMQADLINRWRLSGEGPASAPSLQGALRPAIDQITEDLLRALSLAAPFMAEANLETLVSQLPSTRWQETDRRDLIVALRAIHYEMVRSPRRMMSTKRLRIGMPGDYAPFAWDAHGKLIGADIELTQQIASRLGLEPVYVRSSWATLLDDLSADHFDIAAGGISINDTRRARAGFSVALTTSGKTAIGRCADRFRLGSLDQIDQADVRVIENPGGTNETFARRHLTRAHLTIHPDNLSIFSELSGKRADVMFTDDIEITRVVRNAPSLCRLMSTVFEPAEKALLLPDENEWAAAINPAVAAAVESGQYARWLENATSQ